MAYRALTDCLLGIVPGVAHPGDILPDTYIDSSGDTQPVDFDRLLSLEAVERVEPPAAPAKRSRRKPKD